MNKNILTIAGVAVVAGLLGFYGGMQYGAGSRTPRMDAGRFGGEGGTFAARRGAGITPGGGMTAGEVTAKDAMGLTVKLRDGGSKVVFVSAKTNVLRSASGTLDDVAVGSQVVISGAANQDGSITAESVQIRPGEPLRAGPIGN